jgi:hypothetical protein
MRANATPRVERCEGITSANVQCKCWATQRVNEIPYCDQHAAKVLREVGKDEPQR